MKVADMIDVPPFAWLWQELEKVRYSDGGFVAADERSRRMLLSLLKLHEVKYDVCGTRKTTMGPIMRRNLFRRFSDSVLFRDE